MNPPNEKRADMDTRAKAKHIVAGIVALTIGALIVGWSLGTFIPGTPRQADAEKSATTENGTADSSRYGSLAAESTTEVPYGTAAPLEGLTQGKLFQDGVEEHLASMSDAARQDFISKNKYIKDYASFAVKVENTRVVSVRAFEEWYPHYAEASVYLSSRPDDLVVLVEVEIHNPTDSVAEIPPFALWSDKLSQTSGTHLDGGWKSDDLLLEELYGTPSDSGKVFYALAEDWNMLEPGQTQNRTFPYRIPATALDQNTSDGSYDLSGFSLSAWDCDPPTVYRLHLA